MTTNRLLTIHADGACSGNPGPGGWAYEINGTSEPISGHGSVPDTTNNRMEIEAVLNGLAALPDDIASTDTITVITDSAYVVEGFTRWLDGWKRNGWRTAARKPVANTDLWQRLDDVVARLAVCGAQISFQWVKGHHNDPINHRVDIAAFNASQSLRHGSTQDSPSASVNAEITSSPAMSDGFDAGFEAAAAMVHHVGPGLLDGMRKDQILAMLKAAFTASKHQM